MIASAKLEGPVLDSGEQMYALVSELYPICRSITGNGVRETLRRIARSIPLQIHEVASGTKVFDWSIPREWNVRDAWVKDSSGDRIIDFQRSNLHIVSYSVPVHCKMTLSELKPHLHTLPDRPDWIPYRTSYYQETWGFCLAHRDLEKLRDDEYEICIDATLEDGHLSYGELLIRGTSPEEVLVSCHVCHPSLCNDNLSGVAVAVALAQTVLKSPRRYSYRFLFIPGTIGAITWLALNEEIAKRIRHGLVLAGLGDGSPLSYKKSRRGSAEIDHATQHVLGHINESAVVRDFSPYGYDERQFCSPGFDLPVGRLSRAPHGEFPEYHTSADNLSFVRPESLAESLSVCREIFEVLEKNGSYVNMNPKCEPQLGKRGLYRAIGGNADSGKREKAMLWTLNLSDGRHSLLDIAERSGLRFQSVFEAASLLASHQLLQKKTATDDAAPISKV